MNPDILTIRYSLRLLPCPDVVRCRDMLLCFQSETAVGHALVSRGGAVVASCPLRFSFQLVNTGVSIAAYTGALVRQ